MHASFNPVYVEGRSWRLASYGARQLRGELRNYNESTNASTRSLTVKPPAMSIIQIVIIKQQFTINNCLLIEK
jgi:hypothetical protein